MEKNIEKELQALRKDYEVFKEEMEVQHNLNERVFRAIRKQPTRAVNREIGYRMMLDITTVPVVMMICIIIDWPILFGILVSLWAATDLFATAWMNRKLGMDNLLNDDVRTVTEKIACYRRFYNRMLLAALLPSVVMIAYIFTRMYARADNPDTAQFIIVSGITFTALACVIAWLRYRKHVKNCRELVEQFNNI